MICGISWISKSNIGKNKSMTLEYERSFIVADITFVDLQYTDTSEEGRILSKSGVEIIKLEEIDNFNDIDGLASLINACDKVSV